MGKDWVDGTTSFCKHHPPRIRDIASESGPCCGGSQDRTQDHRPIRWPELIQLLTKTSGAVDSLLRISECLLHLHAGLGHFLFLFSLFL